MPSNLDPRCRPLDTKVSLSQAEPAKGCLCFACRYFSLGGPSTRASRKKKTPMASTTTTTTTIINCDQSHQANDLTNACAPTINLETSTTDQDSDKSKDGEQKGATASNLDDVQRNFIALIRYNKLQYFFLGTIIYSAINTCSIFSLIGDLGALATINNSTYTRKPDLLPVKIISGSYLALVPILLAISVTVSYRFGPYQIKAKNERGLTCSNLLQLFGLLVTLLLFYLQLVFHLLMIADGGPFASAAFSFHWTSLELASACLLYILPLLLEGGTLRGRRIGSLASLPALVTAPAWLALRPYLTPSNISTSTRADAEPTLHLFKLAAYLALALLFGLLRRWQFVSTVIGSTFAGADQLIEAKVSLEHQRQQQETLLLSVLPAYVAAQVKRNMLKSVTSNASAASSPAPCASLSGDTSAAHPAGCPLIHSASSVVQPTGFTGGRSRSRSVDESAPQVPSATQRLTTSDQRSRNPSFVFSEMLTSRLVSGAAYLSETLGAPADSKTSAAKQSNHDQAPPTPTTCPLVAAVAPQQPSGQVRRGFNELYIRTYNNVSLLYGDIVGFTRLCTQLSSSQLVRVLNDLFSHFDRLAERHKIMRIKILGDCYYGVSGIPEFAVMGAKSRASRNDNHAVNCVNMGLDMIQYIRQFNIERQQQPQQSAPRREPVIVVSSPELSVPGKDQAPVDCVSPLPAFELNMRIGIHSGHIHSGVIGLKKWQFDVWSNDVSIAMHCESSGTAGRVQVTDTTIQQLNGAFSYERAPGADRDPFLAAKDTRTYLIRDRILPQSSSPTLLAGESSAEHQNRLKNQRNLKRAKAAGGQQGSCDSKGGEQLEQANNIRAATIGTIRQTLLSGDESLGNCTDEPDSSGQLAFNYLDMRPLSLDFRDATMARLYSQRRVENLAQELLALCLILMLLHLVNQRLLISIDCPLLPSIICLILSALLLLVGLARGHSHRCTNQSPEDFGPLASPLSGFSDRVFVHQIISERTASGFNSLSRFAGRTFARLSRLCATTCCSTTNPERARRGVRLAANGLAALAVIIFQCYTLVQKLTASGWRHNDLSCRPISRLEQETSAASKERNEMTVILLLMLLDSSVNLVSYKTKTLLYLIIIACQSVRLALASLCTTQFVGDQTSDGQWLAKRQVCAEWSSGALLIVMSLWSLFYSHQLEYTQKANFLWRNRLNVDHEELEYISGINKVLLENILPSHVVQHYLTHPGGQQEQQSSEMLPGLLNYMRMSFSNMRNNDLDGNKLYHEQHDGVAVMFASIPHFYEFYDESDISKQGLGCIALLNEIICDFDKLLLKNKFSRIEKIKTIGSTYMAAAGLRPCNLGGARNSTASQSSVASGQSGPRGSPGGRANHAQLLGADDSSLADGATERRLALSQQKQNLICMIQFASNLMTALNGINKQSFQVFKLRVGVNTGPVVAGVIGAQRPFYDIWGDCVNIASRMESLGEVGRIQVEEKTAKLLMESLCTESYSIVRRGPIDVKGKGGMVTYFVDRREAIAPTSDEHQRDTLAVDANQQ